MYVCRPTHTHTHFVFRKFAKICSPLFFRLCRVTHVVCTRICARAWADAHVYAPRVGGFTENIRLSDASRACIILSNQYSLSAGAYRSFFIARFALSLLLFLPFRLLYFFFRRRWPVRSCILYLLGCHGHINEPPIVMLIFQVPEVARKRDQRPFAAKVIFANFYPHNVCTML